MTERGDLPFVVVRTSRGEKSLFLSSLDFPSFASLPSFLVVFLFDLLFRPEFLWTKSFALSSPDREWMMYVVLLSSSEERLLICWGLCSFPLSLYSTCRYTFFSLHEDDNRHRHPDSLFQEEGEKIPVTTTTGGRRRRSRGELSFYSIDWRCLLLSYQLPSLTLSYKVHRCEKCLFVKESVKHESPQESWRLSLSECSWKWIVPQYPLSLHFW